MLKESNTPFTNANDKVDLDTGEPGYGSQIQGPWNPARNGRLADLIVEHSEVHTGCRSPLMWQVQHGVDTDITRCRELLTTNSVTLASSIALADLASGDAICVRTDEGLVALVKIVRIATSYPTTLTIDTIVDSG